MKNEILFFFSLAIVGQSTAQTADSTLQLNQITITENRLPEQSALQSPKNTFTFDTTQLRLLPAQDIALAMQYMPGVFIQQRGANGGQADLTIQGGAFDQSLILINGVKIIDVQTGHHSMNLPVPFGAIQKLTLFRGAQGRMFGIGPVTGALDVTVRPSATNQAFFQTYVAGNLFPSERMDDVAYVAQGFMAGAHVGTVRNRVLLSLNLDRSDKGYRHNTGYNRVQLLWASEHKIKDNHTLSIMASYIRNTFGANAFYAPPDDKDAREYVDTFFSSAKLESRLSSPVSNKFLVYMRQNKDDYVLIEENPTVYQNNHTTRVFGIENHTQIRNGWGYLGVGIDARRENINSSKLGNHGRTNLGVFVDQRFTPWRKIEATAGVYVNYNSDAGWDIFPGVELAYRHSNAINFYTNFNMGMRNPTYTNLYYKDSGNVGNANLRPEKALTADIGARYGQKGWLLDFSYFYRRMNNMIVYANIGQADATLWQPQNVGRVHTHGLNFLVQHEKITVNSFLSVHFSCSYNYLYFENTLDNTKNEIQVLKHQSVANLQTHWLGERLTVGLIGRYNQHLDGQHYGLIDARCAVNIFAKVSAYLSVNNINNVSYAFLPQIPMQGRNYTIGLTGTF